MNKFSKPISSKGEVALYVRILFVFLDGKPKTKKQINEELNLPEENARAGYNTDTFRRLSNNELLQYLPEKHIWIQAEKYGDFMKEVLMVLGKSNKFKNKLIRAISPKTTNAQDFILDIDEE